MTIWKTDGSREYDVVNCCERRIENEKPTNERHLLEIINKVWANLTPGVLDKLVERMPRLCKAVIQAEGGYFDETYAPRLFKNQLVYH